MDQPKIERLLRLMKMLSGSINYTVDEIADKLQMSRRTIYRYIDTLKGAGFVIRRTGDSFKMMKESRHFDDIEQLVHFSEEESYLVNRLIDGLDDTNMLKQNLRKKLATVYDVTAMADCVVRKEHVANTHELISAIENKKQVILHDYSSSNKGDVRDRLVEPFEFTTNYIQVWCYEPQSGMNKLFRVSRMGALEPTDTPWQHQPMHRSEKSDIFRTSGNTPIHIKVEIGTMARNLLLEEFPLAERELTRTKGDKWLLETDIYRLEGAGRFIIGVANDIKIIESEPLKSYLQKFIDEHCKKIAN